MYLSITTQQVKSFAKGHYSNVNIKITAIQSPNAIVYITLSFLYANLTI